MAIGDRIKKLYENQSDSIPTKQKVLSDIVEIIYSPNETIRLIQLDGHKRTYVNVSDIIITHKAQKLITDVRVENGKTFFSFTKEYVKAELKSSGLVVWI